jgi:hypothetical protein
MLHFPALTWESLINNLNLKKNSPKSDHWFLILRTPVASYIAKYLKNQIKKSVLQKKNHQTFLFKIPFKKLYYDLKVSIKA